MSEFLELLGIFFVVLNPAGALRYLNPLQDEPNRRARVIAAFVAFAIALILLVSFAIASASILDLLNTSLPTFQVATGALLVAGALPVFLAQTRSDSVISPLWITVRLALWLASPAVVATAIAYGADRSLAVVIPAIAVALLLSLAVLAEMPRLMLKIPQFVIIWIGRAFAAGSIIVAVSLIREGVQNV